MVRLGILSAVCVVVITSAASAQQNQNEADQIKARQRIAMMEGVLERAVSIGADNMLRQMKAVTPDSPMLTGVPEARGFRLDGYGVFFDVEVPALRLPVTWPLRYMLRENREMLRAVDELRAMMVDTDPRQRDKLAQVVRQLEQQAQGPAQLRGPGALGSNAAVQAQATRVDTSTLDDPNEQYTREVKASLVDAMLENSLPIALGTEEWLTVAARDNVPRDPLIPSDTADFSTVIFRVKGSDLAAFRAGRITLEEVRRKVETREY
jgi:hypothetical protein